jgi:hypothetical protein
MQSMSHGTQVQDLALHTYERDASPAFNCPLKTHFSSWPLHHNEGNTTGESHHQHHYDHQLFYRILSLHVSPLPALRSTAREGNIYGDGDGDDDGDGAYEEEHHFDACYEPSPLPPLEPNY